MTKVKATISVNVSDVDSVMLKLRNIGFYPQIEGQRHAGNERPDENGTKLVLVNFKNWGQKSWRLVEFFFGNWMFEGYEFENMDADDFDIVCWYELPEAS